MEILKVKDSNEKYYTKKNKLSSLPARIIIVGKSALSGKTNLLVNLLCQDGPEFYEQDFIGENMYLVSASIGTDDKLSKLIKFKQIPDENLMLKYEESYLENIYEEIEEKFKEDVKLKKKVNYLIILDDISFSGCLKNKQHGIINKIFSNGRHINCSVILTSQKHSDILTSARENMSMLIAFNCSNKQLDLISDDVNYELEPKEFKKKFRKAVAQPHSFFVVNFFKQVSEMYMDSKFNII
jgi:hypothetical protein